MLTKSFLFVSAFFASLLGFTAAAHAQNAIDPASGDGPGLAMAKAVYDAIRGGHYAYAAAVALVVAVALLRKYGGDKIPALHTDAGSALLVLGGSFGTALSASLFGGGPLTLSLAWSAACVAFAAAGGYAALNAIVIKPLLASGKAPAWVSTIVGWLFTHKSDPGNTPTADPVQ